MPDLSRLQSSDPVVITDTTSAAGVFSSNPTSGVPALAVREVRAGQATMAASFPVVIASDQSAVPVSGTVTVANITTGTVEIQVAASVALTNVTQGVVSTQIVASNANRRRLLVQNTSTTGSLFLKYGTTADTTSSFSVKIPPQSYWEMPEPPYVSQMDGIWDAAGTGKAIVTDIS
jgi:hypothetical protein